DEETHMRLIVGGARLWGEVPQPGRLGRRIGVERGLLHRAATGPKAGADHLVGIRLTRHPVRPGALGGAPPREPSHRKIQADPEKMVRAALSQKALAELLEHVVGLDEDAPEAIGVLGIVRRVCLIGGKANRVLHFDGHGPERHPDREGFERLEIEAVELRHRARAQGDFMHGAVVRPEDELVLDEIELHVERPGPVRHGAGREPARGDVERHLPPMVLPPREGEAGFPDDLGPHVESRVRVPPLIERQRGPGRSCVNNRAQGTSSASRVASRCRMAPRWYSDYATAPIATPRASSSHTACVSTATSSVSYCSRSRARTAAHSASSTVDTVQLPLRSREVDSPRRPLVESATLTVRWWTCPAMVVRPGPASWEASAALNPSIVPKTPVAGDVSVK